MPPSQTPLAGWWDAIAKLSRAGGTPETVWHALTHLSHKDIAKEQKMLTQQFLYTTKPLRWFFFMLRRCHRADLTTGLDLPYVRGLARTACAIEEHYRSPRSFYHLHRQSPGLVLNLSLSDLQTWLNTMGRGDHKQ